MVVLLPPSAPADRCSTIGSASIRPLRLKALRTLGVPSASPVAAIPRRSATVDSMLGRRSRSRTAVAQSHMIPGRHLGSPPKLVRREDPPGILRLRRCPSRSRRSQPRSRPAGIEVEVVSAFVTRSSDVVDGGLQQRDPGWYAWLDPAGSSSLARSRRWRESPLRSRVASWTTRGHRVSGPCCTSLRSVCSVTRLRRAGRTGSTLSRPRRSPGRVHAQVDRRWSPGLLALPTTGGCRDGPDGIWSSAMSAIEPQPAASADAVDPLRG